MNELPKRVKSCLLPAQMRHPAISIKKTNAILLQMLFANLFLLKVRVQYDEQEAHACLLWIYLLDGARVRTLIMRGFSCDVLWLLFA
jgi:hypothetical protein